MTHGIILGMEQAHFGRQQGIYTVLNLTVNWAGSTFSMLPQTCFFQLAELCTAKSLFCHLRMRWLLQCDTVRWWVITLHEKVFFFSPCPVQHDKVFLDTALTNSLSDRDKPHSRHRIQVASNGTDPSQRPATSPNTVNSQRAPLTLLLWLISVIWSKVVHKLYECSDFAK